jgi:hypothetical protein
MTCDYKPGERPKLGSKYSPPTYENRTRDGAYFAYMRPLGHHESLLQTAMLQDVPSNFVDLYEWYCDNWLPRAVFLCVSWSCVLLGLLYLYFGCQQ